MKFLADEQVPKRWADELTKLGFDVVRCTDIAELRGKCEVDFLLPWANLRRRVLLSADDMDDRSTKIRLMERLHRTKRGRVIHISGGPQQPWERAVGKFLVWHYKWSVFFSTEHGVVRLRDERQIEMSSIEQLPRAVKVSTDQGVGYVYRKRRAATGPVNVNKSHRLVRPTPSEQYSLTDPRL